MRAGRPQGDVARLGQREQPPAALVLALERVTEVLTLAGADLHLGGDQLAGEGVDQEVVGVRLRSDLLEDVGQRERVRVEQCELLLEPDREVGRGLEYIARSMCVEDGQEEARTLAGRRELGEIEVKRV